LRKLEFWFEFSSTYTYLTASRIERTAAARGIEIAWRPFLLGPIFRDQGWSTSPFNLYPDKGAYMWRDMEREASKLGLPTVVKPSPFPQNGLTAARIATLGQDAPWLPKFVFGAFSAQFANGQSLTDNTLAHILDSLGCDGPDLIQLAHHDEVTKQKLRTRTEEARQHRIFGTPSFRAPDGELFWGNDRLEQAIEWTLLNG